MKKFLSIIAIVMALTILLSATAFAAENPLFWWKDNFRQIGGGSATRTQIRLLQWSLYKQGYYPELPDGLYGPESQYAVENFQDDNGLPADGIVGYFTWSKLQSKNTLSYTSITGYRYYKIGSDESDTRHFCAYNQNTYIWRVLYNIPSMGYETVML